MRLDSKYKYNYLEEEEDIILTPRTRTNTRTSHKYQDENIDPYDEIIISQRRSMCIVNYEKRYQQEEYQIRRKEMEVDRVRLIVANEVLADLPKDIIEKILKMAGFYIPTVLRWGDYKNKNNYTLNETQLCSTTQKLNTIVEYRI